MLDSLINLGIAQLWQVTLLVVLVGLVHRLLVDRAPRLTLALWTMVAVKAITPPFVASPLGVFSWLQASSVINQSSGRVLAVDWTPDTESQLLWLVGLGIIWSTGSAGYLAMIVWRNRRLSRLLRRDALPESDPLLRYTVELAERYKLRPPSRVVVSQDDLGPAVAGVLRPTVILPASLVHDRNPTTLRPVLLHELVHTTRRDTLRAVLYTAIRVVWWFNPAVWWAARQAESLVERCVDLTVTCELQTSLYEYGRGLLSVLELREQLQPRPELASLSPCQITTERLNFLRETDAQQVTRQGEITTLLRRIAFVLLTVTVLPALPVDALTPHCTPSLSPQAQLRSEADEPRLVEPKQASKPAPLRN